MSIKLNRLLSKIIPPTTASAGGCEYDEWCKWLPCRELIITYTNCTQKRGGCLSC